MKLKERILKNWMTDITGNIHNLEELENTEFPAWTVKFTDSYGVAIPYEGEEEINEKFANARICSSFINLVTGETIKVLLLTTDSDEIREPFATLCEALIDPGESGARRNDISEDPVSWWKEWKELLGNRNIDERIYDILGELCVLLYAVKRGEEANWNGPESASYDIETDKRFIEVKSSVNKSKREVTINSQFQLFPPEKPLNLIFCLFEPVIVSGISIDDIVNEFDTIGYNTNTINEKLESMGIEKGMSSRKKQFLLQEMLMYEIDDSFPRITPASFVGGILPEGITKITYTVDLSGQTPISLKQGDPNEL